MKKEDISHCRHLEAALGNMDKLQSLDNYKYGFFDKNIPYVFKSGKGLSQRIIQQISAHKSEPKWMLKRRLEAFTIFKSKPMPSGALICRALTLIISIIIIIFINDQLVSYIKRIGLISSFLTLWLSLLLWSTHNHNILFHSNTTNKWLEDYQLSSNWGNLHFAVDEISLPFIVLTSFLIPICILISWKSITFMVKEFILSLLFIHLWLKT